MKKCLSGWKQHLKTAAPRPTTRRKMVGRIAIATRLTHTKWVGTTQGPAHTERAPTRGHEAENLGWRSPSLPRRVRGAAALPTRDDMPSEALSTGRAHIGQAGLPPEPVCHRAVWDCSLCCGLCVLVGHLVAGDIVVGWDPPDHHCVVPGQVPGTNLDGRHGEVLSGAWGI